MNKLLIFAVVLLIGCKDSAELEQRVELDKWLACTYELRTTIWINGSHIEYGNYVYNIAKDSIEVVKKREYDKAYLALLKIQKCIEEDCNGDCE